MPASRYARRRSCTTSARTLLQRAPGTAEVTVYALVMAKLARIRSCTTSARTLLQRAPDTAEVIVYALVMAKLARMSYDDTVAVADKLIARGLPRDEREAYQRCIADYYTARIEMVGVVTDLTNCDFACTMREYHYAMAAMDSCGLGLKAGTPLRKWNEANRDLTTVAYDLGALVINSRRK
jgi:hypothetical protein